MIHTVVTVFDIKAGIYSVPVFTSSKGHALRSFQDAVNTPGDSIYYQHPDDFILYLIGHFDDNTGKFQLCEPDLVISGADAKVVKPAT